MKKNTIKMKLGEGPDKSQTDWARFAVLEDDDIDCSDIPELDEAFFKNARFVIPSGKKQLTVRLDADILDWLKSKGTDYQTRMNTMLRAIMELDVQHTPR